MSQFSSLILYIIFDLYFIYQIHLHKQLNLVKERHHSIFNHIILNTSSLTLLAKPKEISLYFKRRFINTTFYMLLFKYERIDIWLTYFSFHFIPHIEHACTRTHAHTHTYIRLKSKTFSVIFLFNLHLRNDPLVHRQVKERIKFNKTFVISGLFDRRKKQEG